jgi:hypothetical protein
MLGKGRGVDTAGRVQGGHSEGETPSSLVFKKLAVSELWVLIPRGRMRRRCLLWCSGSGVVFCWGPMAWAARGGEWVWTQTRQTRSTVGRAAEDLQRSVVTGIRFLCMAADWGHNILLLMSNRTSHILFQ